METSIRSYGDNKKAKNLSDKNILYTVRSHTILIMQLGKQFTGVLILLGYRIIIKPRLKAWGRGYAGIASSPGLPRLLTHF